jgi:hypothetical protein
MAHLEDSYCSALDIGFETDAPLSVCAFVQGVLELAFAETHEELENVDAAVYDVVFVKKNNCSDEVSCVSLDLVDREQTFFFELLEEVAAAVLNNHAKFIRCFVSGADIHEVTVG